MDWTCLMVQIVVISTLEPGVIIGCGILVSSTMETGKYVSSCKVDMVFKASIIVSSAIRTNFFACDRYWGICSQTQDGGWMNTSLMGSDLMVWLQWCILIMGWVYDLIHHLINAMICLYFVFLMKTWGYFTVIFHSILTLSYPLCWLSVLFFLGRIHWKLQWIFWVCNRCWCCGVSDARQWSHSWSLPWSHNHWWRCMYSVWVLIIIQLNACWFCLEFDM